MEAPMPANESARLRAVRALQLLDTPTEERFDRITRTATRLFDVPIALISLVDENRQWFKSCQGVGGSETPRSVSFCAYALLGPDALIIPDAHADPRFADNPLVVDDPYIQFYAGQPLFGSEGLPVGTLCIIDRRPRQLCMEDLQALRDLAAVAESELNRLDLAQALTKQRESEARIRAVVDNVADGLVTFNAQREIVSLNAAAERMLGYASKEAVGVCLEDVLAETSRDAFVAMVARFVAPANGYAHTSADEFVGQRRDGEPVPLEVSLSTYDFEGERQYIAIIRDITVRKRTDAALTRQTTALEAQVRFLHLAHDTIIVRTLGGTITFWNHGAEVTYGWTAAEAIGESSRHLLHTVSPQPLAEIQAELLRTGRWEGELRHRTRGGDELIVASRWALQRDEDGKPVGVLEINNDVTQRRQAEERLRATVHEMEQLYRDADRARGLHRAVLDETRDGLIMVGVDGRILTVNRQFARLFGVTTEEVTGRAFASFNGLIDHIYDKPDQFRAAVVGSLHDTTRRFTANLTQQWPVPRELELFSAPVHSVENEHIGRLYVLRDVTHEREVDRMKSEFVSLVSHELRTPLTSIKGFIDMLLDGDLGALAEEQQDILGIVQTNADRLTALINDLLDVSRIESGRMELKRTPLDLERLTHAIADSLRPQFAGKHQILSMEVTASLPPGWADGDRIAQIVTNLLSNAHKYTPEGGQVCMMLSHEGNTVRVDVRDTGIGLSTEEQQQLFTRFFRADNAAARAVGGTGLGLYITRSLVETHGGQMTVTSARGEGSTFSFTLPVASAA